jgi:hypothetical protein
LRWASFGTDREKQEEVEIDRATRRPTERREMKTPSVVEE